jgi:Tol biopolymer transport system component
VLSPDASRVLYTVRATNMDKNRGNTQLWLLDLRAPKAAPVRLTQAEASSTDPEWSPTGDAIYFLSARSGSQQVWRLPLAGGEASKVTDLPLDVENFRLSPQGDRLLFSMAVFRDCVDLACSKSRLDEQGKVKASGKVYDKPVRAPLGYLGRWPQQCAVCGAYRCQRQGHGQPVSLSGTLDGDVPSKPFGDHDDYHFSPDGKTVVFSARIAGKTEAWSTNFDIYTVPATGGAPVNLTAENQAWDSKAIYSPDGRMLAYLAMDKPTFEADRFHLVLIDVASGKKRTWPITGTARSPTSAGPRTARPSWPRR